jgi:hypothetical protein
LGVFNRRSFRVDILPAFGTLLLVTFLAVILYNYRSTSLVVLLLCDDLMDQTTQSVIDKNTAFPTPAAELTELSAQLYGYGHRIVRPMKGGLRHSTGRGWKYLRPCLAACRRAMIARFTFHDLRNTAINN